MFSESDEKFQRTRRRVVKGDNDDRKYRDRGKIEYWSKRESRVETSKRLVFSLIVDIIGNVLPANQNDTLDRIGNFDFRTSTSVLFLLRFSFRSFIHRKLIEIEREIEMTRAKGSSGSDKNGLI